MKEKSNAMFCPYEIVIKMKDRRNKRFFHSLILFDIDKSIKISFNLKVN